MGDEIPLGLSFDDVLLVPQHSAILPAEVEVHTGLGPEIPLNIPVLSSAMDTVSEDALAIALAREGGMGVIHRNCPIEIQAAVDELAEGSTEPNQIQRFKTVRNLYDNTANKRRPSAPVVSGDAMFSINSASWLTSDS